MKVLFAVTSLLAVVAVLASSSRGDRRYRFNEVDERDVEPFRAGQTIKYRFDTQISSGMASVSDQHAVTRLQAQALLHFQTDRLVSLKLNDVVVGTLNHEIQEPEKVQPMQMFKESDIKSEQQQQLELPLTFDYEDGLVERIRFHQQDQPWSKNIKKSLLNMLQSNLKQRKQQGLQLEQQPEWKQEKELNLYSNNKNEQVAQMFVMPEITLEGECQVAYTINKVNSQNKFNAYYDNEQSSSSSSDLKVFNVTKAVDFHRCQKIADIRFGSKIEKPCQNCTSQQELEERRLDRTTIVRQVVVGTPEKYGIKQAEVVSHYIFKMLNAEQDAPMHTIVAGQLTYVRMEESRQEVERELKQVSKNGQEETLLYNTEWDEKEKLFYMFGDEEFPQGGPFEKVQDKVNKAENLMKKVVGMWSDKQKGIESEATITYSRLVEVLRMCSQDELKEIYQRIASNERFNEQEQHKAQDILIDALANAGTLNTIQVFTEKVLRNKIQPARATRAIFQLKDVPAPSGKQVEILANLCENEICNRHGPCRQVCWLTVGTLMGELCSEQTTVQDSVEQKKPQCHQQLKKKFLTKAMNQYEKLETRYEKIVLLKAVGNAGCDMSVQELEKIIRNIREDPIVRMQAIDSLRRLRAVMPQKIQRVLLPVFQNVRERPEVRMQALSQILATFPEHPILDQISYTLLKEPSRQVKSFVYMAMKQLAQSPIEVEQELAKHLKALLKLANITEEDEETLLRGSRYYRVPIYSQAKKEGFFTELESIVGTDNILPKQLSAGLDTLFNGLFQKNSFELTATQEDLEQWAEKIMDLIMDFQYGSKKSSGNSRASRYSSRRQESSTENDMDFKKMIQELSVKRRSRVDSDSNRRGSNSPYAMLSFRYGDIDYAVLPLEEEILPQALKRVIVQGQQPSFSDFEDLLDTIKGRPFRAQAALNLLENSVKIPTSAGLPIRVWHVVPVLASVEGSVKPQWKSGQMSAEVKLHPTVSATHFKRVEVQSPIVNSGVETTRTASFNLPLTSEVQIRSGEQQPTFKWTVNVPEKQFRAINLHTLPATYTTEIEWTQIRTPIVKRIENQQLLARAQHIEKVFGKQAFGMPLKVQGEIHYPHQMTYEQIIRVLMTTENHMQVFFQPTEETPSQIIMTAQGEFFKQADNNRDHESFKNFHSQSRFDDEMDQHYEEFGSDDRQFDRFVDSFMPSKTLKHFAKIQIETRGGRQDKQAQAEIHAQHDSQLRHIKVQLKAKRSALPAYFDEENKDWAMNTQIQAMLPEVHSSLKQYQENRGQKQQKFVAKIQSEWGSSRMQKINVNINGEQARNQEWRQKLQQVERLNTQDAKQLKQQMIQKVAFINKYDISADFEDLTPATKNFFNTLATVLKTWNFWQTSTELKQTREQQVRSGELKATVVIDPMTHEHLNVTLKTPVEIVRINSLALPMKAKPFKLVKPGQMSQKSVDSFSDLVSDYAAETGRQECKVDSRKVRSFDDVIFKAPITKCWSVLAKDCANPESPRFAVTMKKINGQDKKLKVKLQGDVIDVEPKGDELIVKINGQQETSEDTLEEFGIQQQQDLVRISNRDITVTFDGQQATIKLSPKHKQAQCGLCGHYDDDTEDEFRMADNELTEDLKTYHKSYTLQEQECREDFEQTHRQEEFKRVHNQRQQRRQQQLQQQSGWDWESTEDSQEYEQESRRQQQRNDNDETEPIEKTEVMEYNHKICFSVKPVKTCPEESYPSKTKEMKVGFTCMDRSSSEARQLLRQARRSNQPLDLPTNKPSFVESLTVPSTCTVY